MIRISVAWQPPKIVLALVALLPCGIVAHAAAVFVTLPACGIVRARSTTALALFIR